MKIQKNMLKWKVLGVIGVILFSAFFVFNITIAQDLSLKNPLKGTPGPQELIGNIIKGVLGVTGSIALLMFIYGGMTWMLSGGASDKVEKGRKTFVWAILGIAVILSSYILVDFIFKTVAGK